MCNRSASSYFQHSNFEFLKPDDLLEYKVYIEGIIPMDIFFLYHDHDNSWVGGLSEMTKYR